MPLWIKSNRIHRFGIIISIILVVGVFGPWLTLSYDPDSRIDPVTKLGERFYHSRIELNPFFGSLHRDEVLVGESWFISSGTTLGGVLILASALLIIFQYQRIWVPLILFVVSILGFVSFFMSLGRGIAIGVITQIGWGMWLTGFGILMQFLLSMREMSKNNISRFMD